MSRWTHVTGSIRIDHLPLVGPLDVASHFRPWTFEDDNSTVNACNMPAGSEGSLQRMIWENPDGCSLAAYTVALWGDLRDFGEASDMEELARWFQTVCGKFMVRQAVLLAEDEYQQHSFLLRLTKDDNFDPQWVREPLAIPQPQQ